MGRGGPPAASPSADERVDWPSRARCAPTSRRPGRLRGAVVWLPAAFVVVTEAAWISVVEGLVQAFALQPPALGIPTLALCVASGLLVARLVGRRLGRWWPPVAMAVIVLAVGAGIAIASAANGPVPALAPGGAIAGLAVLRGFAHARLPLAEDTVERLLAIGIPGIACLAIMGGLSLQPGRDRFVADTLVAAILFAGTGVLALTLARLSAVGQGSGWDWRRNPTWLGMTIGVLTVAVALSIPLAAVAGRAIQAFIAVALGPLLIAGLAFGLDRSGRRVLGFVLGAAVVLVVAMRLFGPSGGAPPTAPAAPLVEAQPGSEQLLTIGFGVLLLVVAALLIVILAALWMRRTRPPDEDLVEETRTIDRGRGPAIARRRRRLARRRSPVDAVGAYIALLDDLAPYADVRRAVSETPAEHAARLRAAGRSGLRLDLLAADYGLARYGGLELSPREDRRAIERWRHLRRRLPRPPSVHA